MDIIPTEILVHIFSYLDGYENKVARMTCKSWDRIICRYTLPLKTKVIARNTSFIDFRDKLAIDIMTIFIKNENMVIHNLEVAVGTGHQQKELDYTSNEVISEYLRFFKKFGCHIRSLKFSFIGRVYEKYLIYLKLFEYLSNLVSLEFDAREYFPMPANFVIPKLPHLKELMISMTKSVQYSLFSLQNHLEIFRVTFAERDREEDMRKIIALNEETLKILSLEDVYCVLIDKFLCSLKKLALTEYHKIDSLKFFNLIDIIDHQKTLQKFEYRSNLKDGSDFLILCNKLHNLRELRFHASNCRTMSNLENLNKLEKLTSLKIYFDDDLEQDTKVPVLIKNITSLRIRIYSVRREVLGSRSHVLRCFSNVIDLKFVYAETADIENIGLYMKKLQRLELVACPGIAPINSICPNINKINSLRHLNHLAVEKYLFTDTEVNEMDVTCLKSLNILSQLTTEGLLKLIEKSPFLEEVCLLNGSRLSNSHIEILTAGLKNLKIIQIDVTQTSAEITKIILKNCKNLRILKFKAEYYSRKVRLETIKDFIEDIRKTNPFILNIYPSIFYLN